MPKTATKPVRRIAPSIKPRSKPIAAVEPAETAAPPSPATGACAHHWVIAPPNGGEMSVGKCKVCGTEKEFPNSADDYLWERSVPQSRWTGRAENSGFSAGY